MLKKCLEETQAKLKKSEEKLLQLKKQAEDKFEKLVKLLDFPSCSFIHFVSELVIEFKKAFFNSILEERHNQSCLLC